MQDDPEERHVRQESFLCDHEEGQRETVRNDSEALRRELIDSFESLASRAKELPIHDRIAAYNAGVEALAAMLDMPHPALRPQLVPQDSIQANDYNPNKVAPPEMQLLRLSMLKDGLTMAVVVADSEGENCTVVDGFHRNTIARTVPAIRDSLHGYLPVVKLNKPLQERIASTVRHNMARGTHLTELSAKLVLMLREHQWSDARICKELGMQADEVLRLKQVTGLADAFKDREFSKAWEADVAPE